MHLCIVNILLGWINCHKSQYKTAEKKLQNAGKKAIEMPSYMVQAAVHFGMAKAKYHQHFTEQAKKHLMLGFSLADQYQFKSIFWISNRDFKNACLMAIELNLTEVVHYAAHTLISRFAKEAVPELIRLSQHSKKPVRDLALDVRKNIHLAGIPDIYIRTFGNFEVRRGDKQMHDSEWLRSQAKTLLKAIIAHGSQNVPKELVAESLWPEIPPEVSKNNFKVTLHRLRKSLEPAVDKTFGFSYLQVHDNLISLDWKLCKVDADQFEFLIQQGESQERKEKEKQAVDCYIRAVELYKGDYLAQDLYTDWIERKRMELKNQYIKILLKLGRIFDNRNAVYKAITYYSKAIQADPVLEEACQRLMVLYARKGKINLAIQTYKKCRQTLREEIQAEPEFFTENLYRRIIKNQPKI